MWLLLALPALAANVLWYRDADGDGFGDVEDVLLADDSSPPTGYVSDKRDCDDTDDKVKPGGSETCNGKDDDCDGTTDEGAGCPCNLERNGTRTYLYCTSTQSWPNAKSYCNARGYQLARSANAAENKWIRDTALKHGAAADRWWIGMNDRGTEGVWVWDDGSAAPYTNWHTGEPNDWNGNEDCAEINRFGDPSWNDAPCSATVRFVCEAGGKAIPWYTDADADGFGDATGPVLSTDPVAGRVKNKRDCDDKSAAVAPGKAEVCNGIDDDCDGKIDVNATDAKVWYADTDSDSYGDASKTRRACTQPVGYVADGSDCDDSRAAANPGATERCNGFDDDCDEDIDEDDASDATSWYRDIDGDGWGTSTSKAACAAPPGYAGNTGDCDDSQRTVYPGATEQCNGIDDDCNGAKDDSVAVYDWWRDGDGDGYGINGPPSATACKAPVGMVDDHSDCDDARSAVHPGAAERCNGLDDDCDGEKDEGASDARTWYPDADKDGYGSSGGSIRACAKPSGYVADGTDCDDGDLAVRPGAPERCNDVDDDCDGDVDEGVAFLDWWGDADGDGFGSLDDEIRTCAPPDGYSDNPDDCDDEDADHNPIADEICDGEDDDCDGDIDEGATDAVTWHPDVDGDGFGDPGSPTVACEGEPGEVEQAGDCDDANPAAHPDAQEHCNGFDDDCDGTVDLEAADAAVWFTDADADGYGRDDATWTACEPPPDTSDIGGDCDDDDPDAYPGAPEEPGDGVDQDCDGADLPVPTSSREWVAPLDTGAPPEPGSGCGCEHGGGGVAGIALLPLLLRRRRAR